MTSVNTSCRIRQVVIGKTIWRRRRRDKGWGGRHGQYRRPAKWVCIYCGRQAEGDDQRPWIYYHPDLDAYNHPCCDNGHTPCHACGKPLPNLSCGCPREHPWRNCPGKTETDRMRTQHAAADHKHRPEAAA